MKIGYLNINGLLDGGHGEYLNDDKNQINLDLLALAESKLDKSTKPAEIEKILAN